MSSAAPPAPPSIEDLAAAGRQQARRDDLELIAVASRRQREVQAVNSGGAE